MLPFPPFVHIEAARTTYARVHIIIAKMRGWLYAHHYWFWMLNGTSRVRSLWVKWDGTRRYPSITALLDPAHDVGDPGTVISTWAAARMLACSHNTRRLNFASPTLVSIRSNILPCSGYDCPACFVASPPEISHLTCCL